MALIFSRESNTSFCKSLIVMPDIIDRCSAVVKAFSSLNNGILDLVYKHLLILLVAHSKSMLSVTWFIVSILIGRNSWADISF